MPFLVAAVALIAVLCLLNLLLTFDPARLPAPSKTTV